ncbi:hypothetical protein [Reichenbachiella versicolor]|uniref:hypothetical protein n=1 Tax=Reichenbachiella versicolor TaxID=1821036 RepID=UPI000D6E4886|nr:hypothetical protein [Reichenbachiella versicolor]
MKLKWPLLIILIGLPVGIYLFLQMFGENKFAIPVYYQGTIEGENEPCEYPNQTQYKVPNFLNQLDSGVLVYGMLENRVSQTLMMNIQSFLTQSWKDRVHILLLYTDSTVIEQNVVESTYWLNDSLNSVARCALVLSDKKGDSTFVLCDTERRVRGYYDISDLEELDRLVIETRILLEE